jgi:uncharacterized protein YjiS (DUF1127 family)
MQEVRMSRSLIQSKDKLTPLNLHFVAMQANLTQVLQVWRTRQRRRAELCRLLEMGPNLIADIGMTVEEAEIEAGLPFWKPKQRPESRIT